MNVEAARRLLADTELKESMSLLRNKYKIEFENADPSDLDGLFRIRVKFDLIRDFYSELQKVLNNELMSNRKKER